MMHAPIVAAAMSDTVWWADLNARIAGHVAQQTVHEAEITRLLDEMAARHLEEAAFLERWNAMSYREAVAFQREREPAHA